MLKLFHFLHSSETVASFQRFCGIRIIRDLDEEENDASSSSSSSALNQNGSIGKGDISGSESEHDTNRDNNSVVYPRKRGNNTISPTSTNNDNNNNNNKNSSNDDELANHEPNTPTDIDKMLSFYSQYKYEIEVGNLFLYYLFCFGTSLGDEIFYISFFPFWFWNVDGYVGRRLCIFWGAFMYLGQATKDILKVPRPTSPPVVKLEKRYSLEYGMPSTHAMVGAGLPFGIYFLTKDRYLFPSMVTLLGAFIWCSVVCFSRMYMGMHTLLDIVGGLFYVFSLMYICFAYSILDVIDYFVLHASLISLILTCLVIPLCLCIFYPLEKNRWSTSRGDTTIIIAVCSGSLISHWLNYNLGQMVPAPAGHFVDHGNDSMPSLSSPPYPVTPLTLEWALLTASRTLVGLIVLVIVRFVAKGSSLWLLEKIAMYRYGGQGHEKGGVTVDRRSLMIELPYKFFTYCVLTVCGLVVCPVLFKMLYIERETYFTEL